MTRENTPHECDLGKFCNAGPGIDHAGREALAQEAATGPARQIRPIAIDDGPVVPCHQAWPVTDARGQRVGQVTSATWSPDNDTNVAIGMIERSHWQAGTGLQVHTPGGVRSAEVRARFFHPVG